MACNSNLTSNVLFTCAEVGKLFLSDGFAVLINYDQVDWSATTNTNSLVNALVLESGNTGFKLEWYRNLASVSSQYNLDTENFDGFSHSFLGRLPNSSSANADIAAELKGGKFLVVVKTNYAGSGNTENFKVYGYEGGLELAEMTNSSAENGGATLFTLTTPEGVVEPYPYNVLLETDFTTTQASFDSLFVQA
jgi:hypothetical protein